MNIRPQVKIGNKKVSVRKTESNPKFGNKSVLTDSTWRYVEIFLKHEKAFNAFLYWEQAHNFFIATQNLSLISKPLTSYYCFLNATKALLTLNRTRFDTKHGVKGKRIAGHYTLRNEQITFKRQGIFPALSVFLGDRMSSQDITYSLNTLLYNLQYIHRAYCLTYNKQSELFFPINNLRFVHNKDRKEAWFEAKLDKEFSNNRVLSKLIGFRKDDFYPNENEWFIRRNKTFEWDAPRNNPTTPSMMALQRYHRKIRKQLRYIYGTTDLWYIKRKDLRNNIIDRSTLTLTFAAMHRLSELSRYDPDILVKHLERKSSWLLSEFITKSIIQFIDHISSEITGDNFRLTGFRS